MVSGTGALSGAASGAAIGSVVPVIGTGIGAAVGGLIGAFGGGGSSGAAATAPSAGMFTPEMLQQLIAANAAYQSNMEGVYGAKNYGPGGVNVSQTTKVDPTDVKKKAFIEFRMSKGDTLEQATKKANSIVSTPGKSFKDKKGFVKAIKQGQFDNLGLNANGGITADATFTPGGASVGTQSEAMQAFLNNLNTESFSAATGLPSAYRADENRALAMRGGLANSAMQQTAGMNQLGLTPQEQSNVDAINEFYKQEYAKVFDQSLNEGMGSLINSGFTSSSLADNVIEQSMDAPEQYAAEAAAKMAAQYNDILNSRTQRQNTALTGTLNAFNTIGAKGGIDSMFAGNTSGADFGLFTDPQAAVLAAGIQQDNIQNRTKNQTLTHDAYSKPVNFMGSAPGPNWSTVASTGIPLLAGAGKYLAGKFPDTAKGVGAKLTNLYGALDKNFAGMFNGGASPGMGPAELLPGA